MNDLEWIGRKLDEMERNGNEWNEIDRIRKFQATSLGCDYLNCQRPFEKKTWMNFSDGGSWDAR